MWIKICGMTSDVAVRAALAVNVNAVGFVFASSQRQITPTYAAQLARSVPRGVLKVAVFQHPTQASIDEVLAVLGPDIVQTDYEDLRTLRLPDSVQVLPVLRSNRNSPQPLPGRALFEGAMSGTGETTDWKSAAGLAARTEIILAGGLSAANVTDAIARVRPFGVDVSSGVESAPGVKDPKKIAEFVRAVRSAEERDE